MSTPREIEEKFWKALKSDHTMMIGLDGVEDGHARPMTALLDGDDKGPIWFFTAKDNALVRHLARGRRAIATFTSQGHDVFATVDGTLNVDENRANVDRLWNSYIAAWFEGKDDPKLALLRLDAERAEIWVDASSLMAGVKLLFGVDPRSEYQGKVAKVALR